METVARSTDPGSFVEAARHAVVGGAPFHLEVGGADCVIEGELALALLSALEAMAAGEQVALTRIPRVLTTGQAADLLGVSRPTVVAMIDRNELPAHRIGAHRRLFAVDVLEYRARARYERTAALDAVAELSDELGLYDT